MSSAAGMACLALAALLGAAPAVAQCDGDQPDPAGWWEWQGTMFFQGGQWYPGDGLHDTSQRHFDGAGTESIYRDEEWTIDLPYVVACWVYDSQHGFANWVVHRGDITDNHGIEVMGEPGARTLRLTRSEMDGYTMTFAEREPLDIQPVDAATWRQVKDLFR